MKKTLIILILTAALMWLLLLPRLVGGYLQSWVPDWLEELGVREQASFEPGWFSSNLAIADALELELRARHFPPLGLDWIDLSGQLLSPLSDEAYLVEGELGLSGGSRIEIRGDELQLSTEPALVAGPVQLDLEQALDAPSQLSLILADASLSDRLGNHLNADRATLELRWSPIDEAHLALSLALEASAPAGLALELRAEPVEREALAQLIEGLQQLVQAPAEGPGRQFALLTVAGAWQQLSAAGLEIELERLDIGSGASLTGQWATDIGQPELQGSGESSALIAALGPVVGLSARVPAADAERLIRAWLDSMESRGWILPRDRGFELRYPAPEPDVS